MDKRVSFPVLTTQTRRELRETGGKIRKTIEAMKMLEEEFDDDSETALKYWDPVYDNFKDAKKSLDAFAAKNTHRFIVYTQHIQDYMQNYETLKLMLARNNIHQAHFLQMSDGAGIDKEDERRAVFTSYRTKMTNILERIGIASQNLYLNWDEYGVEKSHVLKRIEELTRKFEHQELENQRIRKQVSEQSLEIQELKKFRIMVLEKENPWDTNGKKDVQNYRSEGYQKTNETNFGPWGLSDPRTSTSQNWLDQTNDPWDWPSTPIGTRPSNQVHGLSSDISNNSSLSGAQSDQSTCSRRPSTAESIEEPRNGTKGPNSAQEGYWKNESRHDRNRAVFSGNRHYFETKNETRGTRSTQDTRDNRFQGYNKKNIADEEAKWETYRGTWDTDSTEHAPRNQYEDYNLENSHDGSTFDRNLGSVPLLRNPKDLGTAFPWVPSQTQDPWDRPSTPLGTRPRILGNELQERATSPYPEPKISLNQRMAWALNQSAQFNPPDGYECRSESPSEPFRRQNHWDSQDSQEGPDGSPDNLGSPGYLG